MERQFKPVWQSRDVRKAKTKFVLMSDLLLLLQHTKNIVIDKRYKRCVLPCVVLWQFILPFHRSFNPPFRIHTFIYYVSPSF